MKDLLKYGALGVGIPILQKNPELLRGFGILGNLAANKLEDREEEEEKERARLAAEGMKKGGMARRKAVGGSVKSSTFRRGDGVAQRGKTKCKIV